MAGFYVLVISHLLQNQNAQLSEQLDVANYDNKPLSIVRYTFLNISHQPLDGL